MFDLEFTGERIVPGKVDPELAAEHQSRYHFAAGYVAGREVADFGCGTGYGTEILRRAGARRVVGFDSAPEAIRYARARFACPGVDFCVADSLCAPFAAGRFDVVVSFEVIEHVSDHRRFLAEVRRTLRPHGLLLLSTPNKRTYRDGPAVPPNPFHVHEFHLDELRLALADLFPAVAILGQSRTEGAYFYAELPDGAGPGERLLRLVDAAAPRDDFRLESADYFLALCAADPAALGERGESFCVADDNGLRTRNHRIVELQGELEARTRWAQQLESEVEHAVGRADDVQARLTEAERRADELAREGAARERRIAALEQRVESCVEADGRLAGLEAELRQRLDRAVAAAAAESAGLRAELERLAERVREHDGLVRWHRDSLVLQKAGLERQGGELAARREEISGLARELDRFSAELDGHLRRLDERAGEQDAAIARQAEEMRQLGPLAERARELIDMLWGSRSWRLYTGLARLAAAVRPRSAGRREGVPEPLADGAEAGGGERAR